MNNLKVILYEDKYRQDIINFLIKIAINEFGFETWRDYLLNKSFEPYKLSTSKFWIVLNENNNIVGTCGALKKDEDAVKMNSFYVDSTFRKQGIGALLYEKLLNFARAKGYKKIILCAHKENVDAIKFYEKRGFVIEDIEGEEFWYKKDI